MSGNITSAITSVGTYTTFSSTTQTTSSVGGSYLRLTYEVAIALVVLAIIGAIVVRVVERVALRAGASKSVAQSVREWLAVLFVALGIVVAASITGISSELTTLTAGGIVGLVVSLALQNTLSNIISGVLMLQDGILRIGDRIQFGSVTGEVVRVNMRTTWVRDKDGVITVIGNSNLAAGPIVNFTSKERLAHKLLA